MFKNPCLVFILVQYIPMEIKKVFYFYFLIILAVAVCCAIVEYFKNIKYNKLYLTNKKFIVVAKNNIESIEFSDVKYIVFHRGNFFLRTKDKKTFKFFSSDSSDLIV